MSIASDIPSSKHGSLESMSSNDESAGLANGAYYQKYYEGRPPEAYGWLLSEIVRYGRPGNILDLGCGVGLFVELASKWSMDVRGCDGSKDGIAMAQNRNAKLNLVHAMLGDPLPFEEGAIDTVVLNQVIEHLPAPVVSHVLGECHRILRKDGAIFIFSPNKANKAEVEKDPTHINPLYPSALRALLHSAGFEIFAEPNDSRFHSRLPLVPKVFRVLMKTPLRDWLSASTNAYAKKL